MARTAAVNDQIKRRNGGRGKGITSEFVLDGCEHVLRVLVDQLLLLLILPILLQVVLLLMLLLILLLPLQR
jgi:hypothetical protein